MNVKKIQHGLEVAPLTRSSLAPITSIQYPLETFETRSNFITAIVAPTGSGKSVLVSNLIRKFYYKQFDKIYFCSSNVSEDGKVYDEAYNAIEFDETRVFPDINDDIATYIKMDIETDDDFEKKDFRTLLIIDDLITSITKRNKELIKFILKSRHLKCSVLIITHKFNMLLPVIRNVLTHIIIFRSKSKQELETIYKGIIDLDYDDWLQAYTYATSEKHSFLYVVLNKNPQLYFRNFDEEITFS